MPLMDLPPQAWPAHEVQMVRDAGAENCAWPLLLRPPAPQSVIVSNNLIAASTREASLAESEGQYAYVLSACGAIDLDPTAVGGGGLVNPLGAVYRFFRNYYQQPDYQLPEGASIKVLSGFKHGDLNPHSDKRFGPSTFQYVPHDLIGFLNNTKLGGVDNAVFEVTVDGKKIKLLYKILANEAFSTEDLEEGRARDKVCPVKVREIKPSNAPAG